MTYNKFDNLFKKSSKSKAFAHFTQGDYNKLISLISERDRLNYECVNYTTIELTRDQINFYSRILKDSSFKDPSNLLLINKLVYPMFTNMVNINYRSILESTQPISYLKKAMNSLDDADFLSCCSFFVMNTLMLALTLAQRFSNFLFSNALNFWLSLGWDAFDGLTGLYGAWKLAKNGETFMAMVSTLNNLQLIGTTIFSILFLGIINSPILKLSMSTTMGILGVSFTLSVIIPIAMDYWAVQQCKERKKNIAGNVSLSKNEKEALNELENIQINFHYNNMKAWSVCALSMTVLTVFTFIVLSHLTLGGLPAAMLLSVALAWIGSYLRGVWLNYEKTKDIELKSGHDVCFLKNEPSSYENYKNQYLLIGNNLHYVNSEGNKVDEELILPKSLKPKIANQPCLLGFFKTTHKLHLNPHEVQAIKNTNHTHKPKQTSLDLLMINDPDNLLENGDNNRYPDQDFSA